MGTPVSTCLGLFRIQHFYDGDYRQVLALAAKADRLGIDQITLPDHIAISGDGVKNYHNRYPMNVEEPWYEPISVLSAIAGVTERIRLSTGVFIAPLRPAVLLAKQLATLDVLSHGRVDIGIGVGWQKEEYEAQNMVFAERFAYLDEQIQAMRALWTETPASFHGKHIDFTNFYSYPQPWQKGGIPIWLGVAPSKISSVRVAKVAAGWLPNVFDVTVIAEGVAAVRAACTAIGRDPDTLAVRAGLGPVRREDGSVDLDATFAMVPKLIAAGVTVIQADPMFLCSRRDEIDGMLERLAAVKQP